MKGRSLRRVLALGALLSPWLLHARPLPGPDWMWEPVLPGYAFFRQDRLLSGSAVLGGRLGTLAAMLSWQARSARYASAATAAENADLYYGPGMRYRDPYSGAYRSSRELRNMADRSMNLATYAAGLHLVLVGVGILAGIENEETYEREKAPVIDKTGSAVPAQSLVVPQTSADRPFTDRSMDLVRLTIPLDF